MPCPLCRNAGSTESHRVPESMFGTGETFEYRACSGCGTLYLTEVPPDLGAYYGAGYYSFASFEARYRTWFQRWSKRRIVEHVLEGGGPLGALMRRFSRYCMYPLLEAIRPDVLARGRRILDVGCGRGELLRLLANAGWTHLRGVDPFLEEDLEYPGGLRVSRCDLAAMEPGTWDTVMFHHSFEHVPDPLETLRQVRRALAPGGVLLLQIPTVSSRAWREYGVDWIQLDAPRHLFLPSRASFAVMAEVAGLELREVVDWSSSLQFWGSEQLRRGIPLRDPRSLAVDQEAGVFTAAEIAAWEVATRQADAAGEGDQVLVYLEVP